MRTDLGHDVSATRILERSRIVMRTVPYAFVCTTDDDGHVNARQVQPLSVGDDLTMWFGTSSRSRKVGEISRSHEATITFDLSSELTTVVARCRATISADPETRRARWKEGLRPFFADGPDSDEFVAVCLEPEHVELIDFANGITPEPVGHRLAVIQRTGSTWTVAPAERWIDPVPLDDSTTAC